ncbi:MAG: glycosyltransferase family 2 protein [Vicinamibacteraceae bacterium]
MNLSAHVTIVICSCNREAELRATLDHLLAQDHRAPIIVVDNGSTDTTALTLANERRVRTVSLGKNIGAAARNLGVELATTPYVALVDDDTRWEPDALPRAVARLAEQPCLAGVTGRMLVGPHGIEDPISRWMAASPLRTLPGFSGSVVLGFLAGASVFRRQPFLRAGGFNPRFFVGGEEELLALDLAADGWYLSYMEEMVVWHFPSPHRNRRERDRMVARNALWVAWLRRPYRVALRRTFAVLQRSRRDAPQVLRDALAGAGWVWRNRRRLPAWVERDIRRIEAAGTLWDPGDGSVFRRTRYRGA